jgi:DNA polymerase-3 subunit epsilon
VGASPAEGETARLREALADLLIPPWPHAGPIAVVEPGPDGPDHWHVFDRWRHLGSATDAAGARAIAASAVAGPLEPEVYRLLRARIAAGAGAESAIIALEPSPDATSAASAPAPHPRSRPCPTSPPPASMAASPATA